MSIFSNPASNAAAAADEYRRNLLELLGDREPLASMEKLVPAIEKAIEGLSRETLRIPERQGKWSIAQVLNHLSDSDVVYGFRARMIIAQDEPPLTGFDQDLFAERLGYRNTDPQDSLDVLRVLRRANLRMLRSLEPEAFQRAGIHSERGRETLDLLTRLTAAHDLVHIRQIERIRAAVT